MGGSPHTSDNLEKIIRGSKNHNIIMIIIFFVPVICMQSRFERGCKVINVPFVATSEPSECSLDNECSFIKDIFTFPTYF